MAVHATKGSKYISTLTRRAAGGAMAALLGIGGVTVAPGFAGAAATPTVTTTPAQPVATKLVPFGPSPAAGLGQPIGAARKRAIYVDFVLKNVTETRASSAEKTVVGKWLHSEHVSYKAMVDSLEVRVTTSTAARLLHVTFSNYRSSTQGTVYASTRPRVPASVAKDLVGILGLNDVDTVRPALTRVVAAPRSSSSGSIRGNVTDSSTPCPAAGTAVSTLSSQDGITAQEMTAVGEHYGIGTIQAAGDEGSGETIALVELAGSDPSDIQAYDSCFGLNYSNYSVVAVDGGGSVSFGAGGTSIEADLDIEQLQTQAPEARIVSYEGPETDQALYDEVSEIVTADTAKVVSISWGGCGAAPDYAGEIGPLFATAAAQGQSIFVATGDRGSECDYNSSTGTGASTLAVGSPADDPNVTGVGGTEWSGVGDTDVVWNDCAAATSSTCAASGTGGASTGGIDTADPEPSYQLGVQASGHREEPDISGYAQANLIYYDGQWGSAEGTSFAAPLIAGLATDAAATCTGTYGNINPYLYAAEESEGYGTTLTDVTSGNNDFTDGFNHQDYQAGAGYDLATGLGVPAATGWVCPQISSVSDTSATPGSSITISGTNLANASVSFGSAKATITSQSATSITATIPNNDGTVELEASGIVGYGGESFTYAKPTVTSAASTTWTAGQSNSFIVTTSGYDYPTLAATLAGGSALPSWLSFAGAANGTGTLSADPTAAEAGVYSIAINATDASGTMTQTFTLTIDAAPVFTTTALGSMAAGASGSIAVTAEGYPAPTLSLGGGAPAWLSLTSSSSTTTPPVTSTYDLTGTPTAAEAGPYSVTIDATSSSGTTTQTFSLAVLTGPAITSSGTATFTTGQSNTYNITTTGYLYPTLSASLAGGAALPSWLSFADNGNGTGTLTANPTASNAGVYSLTLGATNATASSSETLSLTVTGAPTFSGASSGQFTANQANSLPIEAVGYPAATLSLGAGAPSWLSLGSQSSTSSMPYETTSTLGGDPTPTESGPYSVTIIATNTAGSTDLTYNLTVLSGPQFTSASSTTFIAGQANSFTVTTTGTTGTTITDAGAELPASLTFVDNGNGSATLSGDPSTSDTGFYQFALASNNGLPCEACSQIFSLTVDSAPYDVVASISGNSCLTATSATSATWNVNCNAAVAFSSSGRPPPALSLTSTNGGALPSWLSWFGNGGAGFLEGDPTSPGTWTIVASATNVVGASPLEYTITVPSPASNSDGDSSTPTLSPAPNPTSPPAPRPAPRPVTPVLAIESGEVSVSGVAASVSLRCSGAHCSGTLGLSTTKSVSEKRGKKTVKVTETVNYGSGSYSLAPGSAAAKVTLSAAARSALDASKTHRISADLTASVGGGSRVTKSITLETAPSIRLDSASATATHGRLALPISCTEAACSGTLSLLSAGRSIGSVRYALAAGKTRALKVVLSGEGTTALARAKSRLAVTEQATVSGGATVRRALIIR